MAQPVEYDVVVLGAGVTGLSIALELVNRGLKPAIIARDLPEDSYSTGFASPWAGCNWHTFANGPEDPQSVWDLITYNRLGRLAEEHPELCEETEFVDVFMRRIPREDVWFADHVKGFEEITATPSNPLPANHTHAHRYRSYLIHAPKYIIHLSQLLKSHSVPIIRTRVSSLDEAYYHPEIGEVELVVNATGLGSLTLIGVEDDKVFPARGQIVLVDAPGVRRCTMQTDGFVDVHVDHEKVELPKPAYIIPRPGGTHVVLGGTYLPHEYSSLPDLKEAERIMRQCYKLDPLLAGPDGKSWRDIKVASHGVGLRPAREGGARVELEERVIGEYKGDVGGLVPPVKGVGRKVGVVHAYGLGAAGFQASLGVGEKVADLVEGYLKEGKGSGSTEARLAKLELKDGTLAAKVEFE